MSSILRAQLELQQTSVQPGFAAAEETADATRANSGLWFVWAMRALLVAEVVLLVALAARAWVIEDDAQQRRDAAVATAMEGR